MRALGLMLILAVPACGDADEPELAEPTVTPQAIGYPDIEANNLHGASCAFASGTSMAPIAIAFVDEAVMKIGGQIHRFRADAENEGAQLGIRTRYLAEDNVLLLTIDGAEDSEEKTFTGSVRLLDGAGIEVFATTGAVQCVS
jgi:hypothetical protein